jgi:hypothetical protein
MPLSESTTNPQAGVTTHHRIRNTRRVLSLGAGAQDHSDRPFRGKKRLVALRQAKMGEHGANPRTS